MRKLLTSHMFSWTCNPTESYAPETSERKIVCVPQKVGRTTDTLFISVCTTGSVILNLKEIRKAQKDLQGSCISEANFLKVTLMSTVQEHISASSQKANSTAASEYFMY